MNQKSTIVTAQPEKHVGLSPLVETMGTKLQQLNKLNPFFEVGELKDTSEDVVRYKWKSEIPDGGLCIGNICMLDISFTSYYAAVAFPKNSVWWPDWQWTKQTVYHWVLWPQNTGVTVGVSAHLSGGSLIRDSRSMLGPGFPSGAYLRWLFPTLPIASCVYFFWQQWRKSPIQIPFPRNALNQGPKMAGGKL